MCVRCRPDSAGTAWPVIRSAARVRSGPDDAGFTLLETLLSLALICTMMAALAPFLISWTLVSDAQRHRQVAIALASDAMERVRSLSGDGLLEGRSRPAVLAQWAQAPADVRDAFATAMLCAWDGKLSTETAESCATSAPAPGTALGAQAPLPTEPVATAVAGVTYWQHWYVGQCWQSSAADARCDTTVGTDAQGVADLLYVRVVVAVTWSHRACPGGACAYVTTTLQSPAADPVFNTWQASS